MKIKGQGSGEQAQNSLASQNKVRKPIIK